MPTQTLTDEEKTMMRFGFTESDKRPSAIATGTLGRHWVLILDVLVVLDHMNCCLSASAHVIR